MALKQDLLCAWHTKLSDLTVACLQKLELYSVLEANCSCRSSFVSYGLEVSTTAKNAQAVGKVFRHPEYGGPVFRVSCRLCIDVLLD